MESRGSTALPEGWGEAVGALAEIDQQHRFLAERLGRYQWRFPLLGVVLGAAAASLVWHNTVWFCVVMVLFMAGILPLIGTPVKLAVVPRDGRGSRLLLFTGCLVLFVTPVVATTGPWWTPLAAGVFIAVFVTAFGSWHLAVHRAELSRAPQAGTTWWDRLIERLAPTAPFAPVLAVAMCAATVLLASDHVVVSGAALAAYLLGAFLLLGVQNRIGEIPPDRRPSRLRAFIPSLVLILAPQAVLAPSWPNAWWPAIVCGPVVAGIVVVLGRWQRLTLLASGRYRAAR